MSRATSDVRSVSDHLHLNWQLLYGRINNYQNNNHEQSGKESMQHQILNIFYLKVKDSALKVKCHIEHIFIWNSPVKVYDITVFPLMTLHSFTLLTKGHYYKTPSLLLDLLFIHILHLFCVGYTYPLREISGENIQ